MTVAAKARTSAPVATLNNVLMQLRKNCNHPDLITGSHDGSTFLPDAADLLKQCGKMALLDRLLRKLKARGHNKVLIFSQVRMGWVGAAEKGAEEEIEGGEGKDRWWQLSVLSPQHAPLGRAFLPTLAWVCADMLPIAAQVR